MKGMIAAMLAACGFMIAGAAYADEAAAPAGGEAKMEKPAKKGKKKGAKKGKKKGEEKKEGAAPATPNP